MIQILPKRSNVDADGTVRIGLVDCYATLFKILLAEISYGCACFECIDALEIDAEEGRIEMCKVTIDDVEDRESHL